METVLLATDGSEHAARAADAAIDLAERRDAVLHVLCVVDRRKFAETALSSGEVSAVRAGDHAQHCVTTVAQRARDRGIYAVDTVRYGVPHREVLDYADAVDASAIVLGEHGGHDDHLGGVGRRVRRAADREVLVVPARVPAA